MSPQNMIDHLFRHQYGKMVSIFTRIFGLQHLDTIEDAIQDTFVSSLKAWQSKLPENPEAWLTQAAKHRILDLLRKISAEDKRITKIQSGIDTTAIQELFLEDEVEDNILRMIFTACNPLLKPQDQIAFALKTISGFSGKEIATALLLKETTVKKRLARARKVIKEKQIPFQIPQGKQLHLRHARVLEVIYLIFNEGFYSTKQDFSIREDLCGEAIRLSKCLLKKSITAIPSAYALYALLCFQSARLQSKVNAKGDIISLRDQDRSLWYPPLIALGNEAMQKATETKTFSSYHYEAAIISEHLQANTYASTNWNNLLHWYKQLMEIEYSPFHLLNLATVYLELKNYTEVESLLCEITPKELEHQAYLYYGTQAALQFATNRKEKAISSLDTAIEKANHIAVRKYLMKKKAHYLNS